MREKSGSVRISHPEKLSSYFKKESLPLTFVTISGILYNVGMVAGPYFEGQLAQCLFDIMTGKKIWKDMLRLAVVYLLVILFVQGMRCIKRFYVRRFANNTSRSMRHVLYNNLLFQDRNALEKESIGTLMTKAVADVDACAEGMRKFTTEIFDTGVVLIAYLAMLFYYDWRLALIACAFTPAAYFIAESLKKRIYSCNAAYKASAGRLNNATLDRVSHAVTYRVYGCEPQRDSAYENQLTDYEKKAVTASIWENSMQPLYNIISMTGAVFIIWIGAKNVLGTGWTLWNIAAFTTFLSCFTKMAVKASHAAKLFNAVQKAQVSWKRIQPLMREQQILDTHTQLDFNKPSALKVSDLSFAYPDGKTVLDHISFTAQPGQIIGITGPVACGKSTLGKAFLCEFPYSGSIQFCGQELSSLTDYERSQEIGYLGHAPELINDTIAENIQLGEAGDVQPLLDEVRLSDEVNEMPQKSQTLVGTGGIRLSGGQQARLALARTLYRRRNLLILDDPFSAVDRKTEDEILTDLRARSKDSIILLISHRLTHFPEFDQVIWMENGKALVSSHTKLMEENPAYAAFFETQTKGGIDLDEIQ